jgi:fermentation-respiration switch protein FrsA (DUF1100 family)
MWRVLLSTSVFWLLATVAGCGAGDRSDAIPATNSRSVAPIGTSPKPSADTTESSRQGNASQPVAPAVSSAAPKAAAAAGARKPKQFALDELLLFYPSRFPAGNWKPKVLQFEDVWFQAEDKVRLHGWYCVCDKPRAVLLYAHGNAGNLSHFASLMKYFQKKLRVTVLIFDYRGYGRSEGVATVQGILKDARAARAFLAQRAKVNAADIVLMGRSLGGAVAVTLAAEAPARGLILESTFSSFRDVAAHLQPNLAWLVPGDKLNSVGQIARYKGPLLQSHGDADRTIPYELGRKLFQTAGEPKTFVKISRADHNSPASAEYYEQLDRFLGELPPPGSQAKR